MKKKNKIVIVLFLVIIAIISFVLLSEDNGELKTIKSEKQLLRFYNGDDSTIKEVFLNLLAMPYSFGGDFYYRFEKVENSIMSDDVYWGSSIGSAIDGASTETSSSSSTSSKDYSTTNIQVENVDEADITKTDGDYIYSISENNVIITNVMNPEEIEIASKISLSDIPEDLILYKEKLIVISSKGSSSVNFNTVVRIYDVATKTNPKLIKSYELYEPYYTSRCIDNVLYVISTGKLRKEDKKIVRSYKEDNVEQEIALRDIKYLKELKTRNQTLISVVDLENAKEKVKVSSYLMDISNAYVSENSIYLLDEKYDFKNDFPSIRELFGLKGALGVFTYEEDYSSRGYHTEIYKFDIKENGEVSYDTKNKIKGQTINQYSLDELNGHLRIALYDNDGARVAIFNENLKQIGTSDYVAKGETMYSSRFIGNKVYLVTFKTMDPLFVIDLSDGTKPQVLGELHIPGYSTYLHPYDEEHLIGIGMQTEEKIYRDSNGKVISSTTTITGMKMALFDVSDVHNPIQISETIIGDSRTTSAILTNPKALLFSKERNLIAIPVNNYSEDFEISATSDSHSTAVNSYKNYRKDYVAEGYFVYNIKLEDGFDLKGIITHEVSKSKYYNNVTKLLRGLYIDENLYTVSETAVKVNNLETLDLIDELKIK